MGLIENLSCKAVYSKSGNEQYRIKSFIQLFKYGLIAAKITPHVQIMVNGILTKFLCLKFHFGIKATNIANVMADIGLTRCISGLLVEVMLYKPNLSPNVQLQLFQYIILKDM